MKRNPLWKRIRKHHIPLFLLSSLSVLLVYVWVDSDDVIYRLSMATAYPALALLSATLLTGPIKVLRKRPNPVSDNLTRDIGIWAAIVGLAHVVVGLQVHMRGRMWLLFFNEEFHLPYIRTDLFGTANYTGLVATCILILLLAISNNRSLRALGVQKWKSLQRWNYGLFLLVLVHGILYQLIEDRALPYVYVFAAMGAIVITTQIAGFVQRKRQVA